MAKAVGIDLGTTNSVAAYIKQAKPRVIDNQDNEQFTPSVTHLSRHGEWVVGRPAQRAARMSEEDAGNTVFSIKRFMGRDFNDPDCFEDIHTVPYNVERAQDGGVDVILRERHFSPSELSAVLLESLKRSSEAFLDDEVRHAVITVPAHFGNRQREATRLAGRLAGLNVLRIIPEPAAAALAYGIASDPDEPKTILVYDLGGGSFDVTVMFVGAGVFEDQGKSGDMHLGGDNFDYKIMEWIFEQIRIQHGVDLRSSANQEVKFRLKQAAEEAKLRLSRTTRTQIVIPALTKQGGKIIDLECELKRDDFNGMIKSLVDRSIDLTHEAIKLARTTTDSIDAILLVGGSTRVPLVEETIRNIFGSRVIRGEVNPIYCVAQGAAIETMLVQDVPTEVDEAIIQCDNCGAFNLKSREECRNCSKKLRPGAVISMDQARKEPQPTITCPTCGTENRVGRQNCESCGTLMLGKENRIEQYLTTPHPIGVRVDGDKMEVIIPAGTIYPMQEPKVRRIKPIHSRMEIILPIYEGRDSVASYNQFLGESRIKLESELLEDVDVEVSLSVDEDGILVVTANLPDSPASKSRVTMRWARDPVDGMREDNQERYADFTGSNAAESPAWKDRAQFMLFLVSAVKDEGRDFVPQLDLDHIVQLGAELSEAIHANNERTAQRVTSELEPLIDRYSVFALLAIMRTISSNSDIAANVPGSRRNAFDDLNRTLESLVRQADQARQQRDAAKLAMVATQGNPIVERIMQIWAESRTSDNLSGLLGGASSIGTIGSTSLRESASEKRIQSETRTHKSPEWRKQISVAHPKLLAKRFASTFLVQIYPPEMRHVVTQKIKMQFPAQEPKEHVQTSEVKISGTVKVSLSSSEIAFSEPVVKKLKDVDVFQFIGKPNDSCSPGIHPVKLAICDEKTAEEYESMIFHVQIKDFAFDHVSRPMLSNLMTLMLGIGSFVMFVLTLLGQVDTAFGLTSGTTAGAIASAIYFRFVSLYQRPNVMSSP